MATKRSTKGAASASGAASKEALSSDDGVTLPRLSLQETGFVGLKTTNGAILQEQQRVFRYPHFLKVVEELMANPTVAAAWNVYTFWISRKEWRVEAKETDSDITKERAKLVESMMHDMEDSWLKFIQNVIPYLSYGFGIFEMVPYRRLTRNGSKHNDGIVGLKKLAPRNQDTISKWNFSTDGRELLGVSQSINNLENAYRFSNLLNKDGLIDIPREKFLLFTTNGSAGNPQGRSMFANIYLAHKQLLMLQEAQILSYAKGAKGFLKIELPAAYLSGDAAPDGGAAATAFNQIVDNFNAGTVSGLVVPQQIDPESKLPMFNYGLMESKNTSTADVEGMIKRLQKDILVALSVDVLALGDSGGSYSLAESKTNVLTLAIDAKLMEMKDVLNRQLMPYIYKQNGWDQTEMPEFVYVDETEINMDEFGAFVQRVFSVGAVEVDRPIMNSVRRAFGVKDLPEDTPVDADKLPANMSSTQSRSGDGMASPTGNGTSKDLFGKKDSSTANVANK